MGEPAFDIKDANRWFGVRFNNAAWDLVESDCRGEDENDRMLAAAYAAWCHWSAVGTPLNEQRARHLLATVHAELGHGELALVHAARCMALSDLNVTTQSSFDRGCAFECLARANASAGRRKMHAPSSNRPAIALARSPKASAVLFCNGYRPGAGMVLSRRHMIRRAYG